jgi:arsenite methyltransferase
VSSRRKGSYGIDAPYLLPIPLLFLVYNIADGVISRTIWPFVAALAVSACMACGLYTSLRGKFIVWDELLDRLALRGDERVLDLGCGRGAVLLLVAQRLTTGKAVGVDIWNKGDQSGNSAEATRRNAAVEGVTDRIDLHTADLTALPFHDESYDVVLSSMAIHNVKRRAGRAQAIDEAVRVLRPGGRLLIADLFSVSQYRARLAELGLQDIAVGNLGWRMWWSGPWLPTCLVTASKPH